MAGNMRRSSKRVDPRVAAAPRSKPASQNAGQHTPSEHIRHRRGRRDSRLTSTTCSMKSAPPLPCSARRSAGSRRSSTPAPLILSLATASRTTPSFDLGSQRADSSRCACRFSSSRLVAASLREMLARNSRASLATMRLSRRAVAGALCPLVMDPLLRSTLGDGNPTRARRI
jgi:hypothetical protein